jgi:hypothetical protein
MIIVKIDTVKTTATFKNEKVNIVKQVKYSRSGTESPNLTIYITDKGIRILPVHHKYGLFSMTLQEVFQLLYGMVDFCDFIYKPNPFLSLITKDDNWSGKYIPIPLIYGDGE